MAPHLSFLRVLLPVALAAASLLAAGFPASTVRAAANPELDRLIAKLPDPAKWKESPLQDALDPATHDPDLPRVDAALRKKNIPAALKIMRAVAARYPGHPVIQFTYGRLAVLAKAYPEAERAFRAVAADGRTASLGWYYTGATQFLEDHPRDAAASMRRCLDAHPPSFLAAYAWTALAYYDSLSGSHGESIRAARQGTALAPKSAFMWAMRGFCEANGKQYQAAAADYQRAISLDRHLAMAFEGLGVLYLQTDRPGDAIAPLRTALSLVPGNGLVAVQLGYCYLRAGRPADGAAVCRQAVGAQPGFSKGWDVLGLCYEQLGRKREAFNAFQQAVKTGPGNTPARAHLDQAAREGGARA